VFNVKVVKTKIRELRRFFAFSLSGILYFLWLKVRGKTIVVSGRCRGCGSCCMNLCLENKDGWLRSESVFREIIKTNPEYDRFVITGQDRTGLLLFKCMWCTPQGTCLHYDNRLDLCKKFPEKSLVFAGGALPVNCGYSFEVVTPFANVLKKELQKKK
jgi:hypothetical protein